MHTNIGLVEHVKKALSEKWGYVYGTWGLLFTILIFIEKLKQYPKNIEQYKDYIQKTYLNQDEPVRTADCVGLIKSYLWWNESKNNPVYDAKTDKSANGTYSSASEKGPISSMPDITGLCVWKDQHIGVYIGNGEVIEAKGTKYGVVKTPLKGTGSTPWTHWLKHPNIEYIIQNQKAGEVIMNSLICKKIVTASVLNIREQPNSTDGTKVLGQLKTNDIVQVTGKLDNNWHRINFGGRDAFVFGDYLKDYPEIDYKNENAELKSKIDELNKKIDNAVSALK